jgi:hypothetical protein
LRLEGSGLADPCRRNGGSEAGAVAEVDVQAGQRLEVSGVLQAAGIDDREAHALGQRAGDLLAACAVAGDEYGGLLANAEVRTFGQYLREEGVEGLDDLGAVDLFAPLDQGARIGLLARSAPSRVLVWEACDRGIDAWIVPFAGYSATAADIVLAADDESLAEVRAAGDGALFQVLRAGIRSGHIVCYMLKRRCVLEERGFDEVLDALGFAFMGACR